MLWVCSYVIDGRVSWLEFFEKYVSFVFFEGTSRFVFLLGVLGVISSVDIDW